MTDFMLSYVNKKGKKYFLRYSKTKSGKEKLNISTSEKCAIPEMPEGYEFFENVNGQVFVRKNRRCNIHQDEILLVQNMIEKKSKKRYLLVKADGDEIVLYEPFEMIDPIADSMGKYGNRRSLAEAKEYILTNARYMPFFKFILVDDEKRLFQAQRFCFRGCVDDWIYLNAPNSILNLIEMFVVHFGRDSFYELC